MGENAAHSVCFTSMIAIASRQRDATNAIGFFKSQRAVDNTSSAYFPVWIDPERSASVNSSVEMTGFGLGGLTGGETDLRFCALVGEGDEYCLRGLAAINTVFVALRLRAEDCDRKDAVGLDERPALVFNGEGLDLRTSSQASSSDVES